MPIFVCQLDTEKIPKKVKKKTSRLKKPRLKMPMLVMTVRMWLRWTWRL